MLTVYKTDKPTLETIDTISTGLSAAYADAIKGALQEGDGAADLNTTSTVPERILRDLESKVEIEGKVQSALKLLNSAGKPDAMTYGLLPQIARAFWKIRSEIRDLRSIGEPTSPSLDRLLDEIYVCNRDFGGRMAEIIIGVESRIEAPSGSSTRHLEQALSNSDYRILLPILEKMAAAYDAYMESVSGVPGKRDKVRNDSLQSQRKTRAA